MQILGIEKEALVGQCGGMDANLPAQAGRDRDGDLLDVDHQRVSIPGERAGADADGIPGLLYRAGRAFRQRPALAAFTVERDVERAMLMRVRWAALARAEIVGREDAADEADQGQAVLAVVAQRVDVPPAIAVRDDLAVEAKSPSSRAAAIRPESAAIGTPAPGCTLPPAR